MKSIDTYLCKEKKEVYKVNATPAALGYRLMTKDAIDVVNRQRELRDRMIMAKYGKKPTSSLSIEPAPLKWPLRLAVAALLVFTIYKGLSL